MTRTARLRARALTSLAVACLAVATRPATAQQPAPDSAKPNNAEHIQRAESLLEHGDYKAAETALKQLAAATPKDAQVQYDLGFVEEHNGEDTEAQAAYTASIAADGTLPEPRIALGLLAARLGSAEVAHTQLQAVSAMTNASPQLRARALRALARLDETTHPDQAADDLLRAAQLTGEQPGDAALTANLAVHAGRPEDAEAAYRRTLETSPGDIEATVGLAALLEHAGRLPEAESLLTPALSAHPTDPQLVSQAAAVYAAEDKIPDAIALLTKLRSLDPRAAADPAISRLLAHLDLLSGDMAGAESLYRALATAHPGDPSLLDDLGSTLVREQHFPEAQTVFARAVTMRAAFPDDAAWGETEGHLAFAASRNHQPQVALQALAQRATVLPNSPASLFLEATAHDSLHQRAQAEKSYRAFLAASNGKLPDEEFEARHRLVALQHEH